MELITREELRAKLARGDDFKLVMTLPSHAYEAKHIPGSLPAETRKELERLDPGDEIVVYCGGTHCPASIWAYHFLVRRGHAHVRRFAGGVAEWEDAGYPLASGAPEQATRKRPEKVDARVRRRVCIPFRPAIV